jgi:hypothetical protein
MFSIRNSTRRAIVLIRFASSAFAAATAPLSLVPVEAFPIKALGGKFFDFCKEPVDFLVKLVFFCDLFGLALAAELSFFVGSGFTLGVDSAEAFGSDLSADSL